MLQNTQNKINKENRSIKDLIIENESLTQEVELLKHEIRVLTARNNHFRNEATSLQDQLDMAYGQIATLENMITTLMDFVDPEEYTAYMDKKAEEEARFESEFQADEWIDIDEAI